MKNMKNFESFTLPIASIEDLSSFYSCDECNAIWKEFNYNASSCKFCDSLEIEELSIDEYYELIKDGLDDQDEIEYLDEERLKHKQQFISLTNLKNNNTDVN